MDVIGFLPYDCTVNDLIDLLEQLPGDALITPFGEYNCGICYNPDTHRAYLDSADYLDELYANFGDDFGEQDFNADNFDDDI